MANQTVSEAAQPMDVLEFIASVIGSLAWPLVVAISLILFRSQIRLLIERIKRVSVGDNSIDISQKLEEAEQKVVSVVAHEPVVPEPVGEEPHEEKLPQFGIIESDLANILVSSPAEAILAEWNLLEARVVERAASLAEAYDGGNTQRSTFKQATRRLFSAKEISFETYSLLGSMKTIADSVRIVPSISKAEAFRYSSLIRQLLRLLEKADEAGSAR